MATELRFLTQLLVNYIYSLFVRSPCLLNKLLLILKLSIVSLQLSYVAFFLKNYVEC